MKASKTQQEIKKAAKIIFFSRGHIYATTQEIADEAGVNRAMIHYYFRKRDGLFLNVLKESIEELLNEINAVFSSDDPLRPKTRTFLHLYMQRMTEYPHLPNFIISEVAKNRGMFKEFRRSYVHTMMQKLRNQIQEEVRLKKMKPISPQHFIVNLVSLASFPFETSSMLKNFFSFNERGIATFLRQRKKIIYESIFNDVY